MDKKDRKKPELLLPASDIDVFRTAVEYGADAVYIGGESYSLRAPAKNFSREEMAQAVSYAHSRGVKVYVTSNIYARQDDMPGLRRYFEGLRDIKPDAVLISDPGVFALFSEVCPDIPVHISTQANNTNAGTFNFWYKQGVRRVVAARELSLEEISAIHREIPEDMEIEAFVHGAMCISYSGRCLLSAALTGRSANKGECTHPCRWGYSLVEETRPGEYMDVIEDNRGTYIMNSRDLCMISHIPDLVDAGVMSLKVEGRMKKSLYVAGVGRAYRRAIDDYFDDPAKYEANKAEYESEVGLCTHRPFGTGFFYGDPGASGQIYDTATYINEAVYVGSIVDVFDDGTVTFFQKNKFSLGDTVEIMLPDGENEVHIVEKIEDEEGNPMESAPHAKQFIRVKIGNTKARPLAVIRKRK